MPDRTSRIVLALVAGLTLVVGWSRTLGLDAMLPQQHEPDPYCVRQAEFLEARAAGEVETPTEHFGPGRERLFYYYPLHLARLWRLSPPPEPPDVRLAPETLDRHLEAAGAPFQRGRLWSAWCSALIVPAVFLLARRFLGPWPSLLAAALAGTSLLHLVAAGQAKPHALAASAIAWGLYGATVLRRRPTPAGLALGGALLGAGICSMHYGVVLAGAGVAALVLRDRAAQRGGWLAWALPAAIVVGLYLWSSPGLLIPPPEDGQQSYRSLRIEDGALIGLGHRIELDLFSLDRPWRPILWLWWHDPALLVLGVAGGVAAALTARGADAARRRDAWVIAAHAVPYAAILLVYEKTFDRYALPLVPVLAVLAAAGVAALVARVPRGRRVAGGLAGALALAAPVLGQARLLTLRTRPDTIELAARWVEEHLPAKEPVALGPGVVLPLIVHPDDLAEVHASWRQNPWLRYQARLDGTRAPADGRRFRALRLYEPEAARALRRPDRGRAWLRGLGVHFVVLENSQRSRAVKPHFQHLRRTLRSEGRVVARFLARSGPQVPFRDFGDQPRMFTRILGQERLGPPMEVWRLEP